MLEKKVGNEAVNQNKHLPLTFIGMNVQIHRDQTVVDILYNYIAQAVAFFNIRLRLMVIYYFFPAVAKVLQGENRH